MSPILWRSTLANVQDAFAATVELYADVGKRLPRS